MKNNTLSSLFIVIYGIAFSYMLGNALRYIYPYGVGMICREDIKKFLIRTFIIRVTFILSGIYFLSSYLFIINLPTSNSIKLL